MFTGGTAGYNIISKKYLNFCLSDSDTGIITVVFDLTPHHGSSVCNKCLRKYTKIFSRIASFSGCVKGKKVIDRHT